MTKPYLTLSAEFFDRFSVPEQIAELWAEWPDLDPGTARRSRDCTADSRPLRVRMMTRTSPLTPARSTLSSFEACGVRAAPIGWANAPSASASAVVTCTTLMWTRVNGSVPRYGGRS